MAAVAGRKVTLKYDADGSGAGVAVAVALEQSVSLSVSAEAIDITSKSTAGWRTLLDDVGVKSAEVSISGILSDKVHLDLIVSAAADSSTHRYIIDHPDFTATADWFISSFALTGEDGANAATFEMTLMSAGAVTVAAK